MKQKAPIRTEAKIFLLACLLAFAACSGPSRRPAVPEHLSRAHKAFSLAARHYDKGCYRQALEGYQAAHELFSAADDLRGVGLSLEAMANVYQQLEDTQSALLLYDEALSVFSAPDFKDERIYVLANKAAALASANKLDQAAKLIGQAEALARQKAPPPVLVERIRGVLLLRSKRFKQAQTVLERALARCNGNQADQWAATAFALARALEASGHREQALALYHQALDRDRHQGAYDQMAADLAAIGNLEAGGENPCQAVDYLKRAAKIEALLGRPQRAANLMEQMKACARSCGIDSTAADFFISRWASGKIEANICR